MSVTGHPGEGPTRAGFAVCDAIGGMTAAFAVSSALYQRTHTGRGQLVDVAMLDATLAFLTTYVTDYTVGGHVQGQLGNRAQSRLPTADVFKVQGRPHPARRQQRQAVRGARAGRSAMPDLPKDRRFVDWPARIANEAALRAIIEEVFASADDKTWEARLTAADVPCSRVWTIPEIVAHPQLAHRDVLQQVQTPLRPDSPSSARASGSRTAAARSRGPRSCRAPTRTRSCARPDTARRRSPRCAAKGRSDPQRHPGAVSVRQHARGGRPGPSTLGECR